MTTVSNWKRLITLGAIAVLLGMPAGTARAGEGCKIFAEITVTAIDKGSLAACVITKNPIVCAIAKVAEDKEVRRAGKSGVKDGCDWVVKQIGNLLSIEVKGPPEKAAEIKKAFEAFEKAKKDFNRLIHTPPKKTKK